MNNIKIIILALLVFSCTEKKSIELTILNNSLNVYKPKDTTHGRITISKEDYKKKANNIIQFKIENNTSETYLLISSNKTNLYFPETFKSLGFENLVFFDENGEYPGVVNTSASGKELFYDYLTFSDIVKKDYYNGIGYSNKSNSWINTNENIVKSTIKIHPGETLYFETYTFLPYKWNELTGDLGGIDFDYDKKYCSKLEFNFFELNEIKDFLTDIQKDEIKKNNYRVFSGKLTSKNQVPVEFIE